MSAVFRALGLALADARHKLGIAEYERDVQLKGLSDCETRIDDLSREIDELRAAGGDLGLDLEAER